MSWIVGVNGLCNYQFCYLAFSLFYFLLTHLTPGSLPIFDLHSFSLIVEHRLFMHVFHKLAKYMHVKAWSTVQAYTVLPFYSSKGTVPLSERLDKGTVL